MSSLPRDAGAPSVGAGTTDASCSGISLPRCAPPSTIATASVVNATSTTGTSSSSETTAEADKKTFEASSAFLRASDSSAAEQTEQLRLAEDPLGQTPVRIVGAR